MNTHDAVTSLVARAQASARRWYVLGGAAIVLGTFILGGGATALQLMFFERAFLKLSVLVGLSLSAGVVVPTTRRIVRRRIEAQRPEWIEDLARREGLNANEFGSFFTLDSW